MIYIYIYMMCICIYTYIYIYIYVCVRAYPISRYQIRYEILVAKSLMLLNI